MSIVIDNLNWAIVRLRKTLDEKRGEFMILMSDIDAAKESLSSMRAWKNVVAEENRRWSNLRVSLIDQIFSLEKAFKKWRFNFVDITEKQQSIIWKLNEDIKVKAKDSEKLDTVQSQLKDAKNRKEDIDIVTKDIIAEQKKEVKELKRIQALNEIEWWVIDKKLWELKEMEDKIIVMTEWQKNRQKELDFFAKRIKTAYKKIGKEINL